MSTLPFPIIEKIEELKTQKKYSQAQSMLEEAIAKYPNRFELYEELADVYIYAWKRGKAKKCIDFAQKLAPKSPTWLYLNGYLCLIKNQFEKAIDYLEQSNMLTPNNPEVLRNLWWAYTMIWDIRKGVILLERALHLSPDDELIIEDLWVALLTQWKIQEARKYLVQIGREDHISDMGFSPIW